MRSFYSSSGLILVKYDYGEADCVFFVLTPDLGKISLIARGVKKITSRKRSAMEVFNVVRFKARRSQNIFFIEEVELVWRFNRDKAGLRGITLAYYFSEVLYKILVENEPNKLVFDFSVDFFQKIDKTRNLKQLRLDFVKKLLIVLGFWPSDKKMVDPDLVLENVLERNLNSREVGIKVLT